VEGVETIVDGAIGVPAPPLRPFVARYTGYWLDGFPPGRHQGLPSGSLTVVLSLGPSVDLAVMPTPAQAPASFDALVAGLHAAPVTIVYGPSQRGIQLDVTPLGARALFGLPAGALASTVLGLDELVGRPAGGCIERLREAPSWGARFAIVDELLQSLLRAGPDIATGLAPEVIEAWRMLVASGGGVEITSVAHEVGWSRRHLAQRFHHELGLSPKQAARVLRFDRARRRIGRPGPCHLAEVALSCGYFDQAHLTREFRELAGMTPTAWRNEQLPSVQDTDADVVAH
jgi:AraC-like DNA-binding protein